MSSAALEMVMVMRRVNGVPAVQLAVPPDAFVRRVLVESVAREHVDGVSVTRGGEQPLPPLSPPPAGSGGQTAAPRRGRPATGPVLLVVKRAPDRVRDAAQPLGLTTDRTDERN